MTTETGAEVYERQDIANTFADFYADLYADKSRSSNIHSHGKLASIEKFTWTEMQTAIKMLKKGKAPDNARVCAEMIKYGGERVQHILLGTFNNIIITDVPTPETWKKQ